MPRTRQYQAPKAPTGLPQGESGALQAAQATMPVAAAPPPVTADPIAAAQGMTPPQGLFTQPSDNPDALPTHGLPIGPGAGPEALPDPRTMQPVPSDAFLIAQHLPTLEAVANQDGAPAMLRQLVRQLRGSLDPRVTQQSMVQQATGADYGNR